MNSTFIVESDNRELVIVIDYIKQIGLIEDKSVLKLFDLSDEETTKIEDLELATMQFNRKKDWTALDAFLLTLREKI